MARKAKKAKRKKRVKKRRQKAVATTRGGGYNALLRDAQREWRRMYDEVQPQIDRLNKIAALAGQPAVTVSHGGRPAHEPSAPPLRRGRKGTIPEIIADVMGSGQMRMADILRSLPKSVNQLSAKQAIHKMGHSGLLKKIRHGIYQRS